MKLKWWGSMVFFGVLGIGLMITGWMRSPQSESSWQEWNDRAAASVQENAAWTENSEHSKQRNGAISEVANNQQSNEAGTIEPSVQVGNTESVTSSIQNGTTAEAGRSQQAIPDVIAIRADSGTTATVSKPTATTEANSKSADGAMIDGKNQTDATTQQTDTGSSSSPAVATVQDGKISINQAGLAELTELPGIGEKKAQAIIDYRRLHGPFRNVNDLDNVKGIGSKMLAKMLPYVKL